MIGNKIKKLRLSKNIKQEELADYLGVSFQAVSKWETGVSVPDIALLPNLAIYFGVTIDELFEISRDEQFERIENMFWQEGRLNETTFEQAVDFLMNVLKTDPKHVRTYENLARLYNHRARFDHELASEYAKKVLELNPESKQGWVDFLEANNGCCGDEWYDNHFTVIEYFKEFLVKNTKNFRGLYAIIENMLADGRYEEVVPYIEEIKTVKDNHQYYVYKGDVELGKGNVEGALQYWNAGVEKYPNLWQAYCSRGERLKRLGKYEEAILDFEKCYTMQESPRITDGLYSLAQIHEMRGEYEKAINDINGIILCLKEDYKTTTGESVEEHKRNIERLKSLMKKEEIKDIKN